MHEYHLLNCEDLLLFSVLHHCQLIIYIFDFRLLG